MSKKVLLVQPHSDDILFSASSFLLGQIGFSKTVLFTVEKGDPKRVAEDHKLVDLFGIDSYINSIVDFVDESYYHYYKEMKFKKFTPEDSWACLEDYFGSEKLQQIAEDVTKKVEYYKKKGYTIVTCLGVGHPMHYFIREILIDLADYFYRDWPHSYKMKAKGQMENMTSNMELEDLFEFSEDDHETKFEIAKQVYKTQSSLLFFEKGYIDKKLKEEFYKVKK